MNQFFQFVQNHWQLWVAAALLAGWILFEEFKNRMGGVMRISANEATMKINRDDAVVLDIRAKDAFASGHVLGSINLPQAEFKADDKKLAGLIDRPIIIIDNTEAAANAVGLKLRRQGFVKLYTLAKGFSAWKEANLPLSKR